MGAAKNTSRKPATTKEQNMETSLYIKVDGKRIGLRPTAPEPMGTYKPGTDEQGASFAEFMECFLLGDQETHEGLTAYEQGGLIGAMEHILRRVNGDTPAKGKATEGEGTEFPQYLYIAENIVQGRGARVSRKSHLYAPLKSVIS